MVELRFGPRSIWFQNSKSGRQCTLPHPAWYGIPCLERRQAVPLCAMKETTVTWIQRRGYKLSMKISMAKSHICQLLVLWPYTSQPCSLGHTSFVFTVKTLTWVHLWFFLALKCHQSMILCVQFIGREQKKPNFTMRVEWYILVSTLFYLAIFWVPFVLWYVESFVDLDEHLERITHFST